MTARIEQMLSQWADVLTVIGLIAVECTWLFFLGWLLAWLWCAL